VAVLTDERKKKPVGIITAEPAKKADEPGTGGPAGKEKPKAKAPDK
jgi:hypothetical protein